MATVAPGTSAVSLFILHVFAGSLFVYGDDFLLRQCIDWGALS